MKTTEKNGHAIFYTGMSKGQCNLQPTEIAIATTKRAKCATTKNPKSRE